MPVARGKAATEAPDEPEAAEAETRRRGRPPGQLSQSHLEALALGREEGRAVRRYLDALNDQPHGNSRQRDPEFLKRKLVRLEGSIQDPNVDALSRLGFVQQRINAERELAALSDLDDIEDIEDAFIKAAKRYGERKGISYQAWRAVGVAPEVLRRAGITRTAS